MGTCFAIPVNKAHKNTTSVTISESGDVYQLSAIFDEGKTKKVQGYMDDKLTKHSDFSFKNAQLNATLTLDSKITFYIKSSPGRLVLKFNRGKNTADSYSTFKKMCEGIRSLLAEE